MSSCIVSRFGVQGSEFRAQGLGAKLRVEVASWIAGRVVFVQKSILRGGRSGNAQCLLNALYLLLPGILTFTNPPSPTE